MSLHLLTRPKGENAEIRLKLEQSGQDCVEENLLFIKKIRPGIKKLQEFLLINPPNSIIITSKNAVFGLQFIFDKKTPVFVISENMAKKLKDLGFKNIIIAKGDAKSLQEILINYQPKEPIIYLRGEHISTEFINCTGISEHVIYRAKARLRFRKNIELLLAQQKISHVWLHSKRSAEVFLQCLKKSKLENSTKNLNIICQSHSIASVLAQNNWATINFPQVATLQAMLELKGKLELIPTPKN